MGIVIEPGGAWVGPSIGASGAATGELPEAEDCAESDGEVSVGPGAVTETVGGTVVLSPDEGEASSLEQDRNAGAKWTKVSVASNFAWETFS